MIPSDLLKMLVCPENRSPLSLADLGLISRINAAISQGRLKNRCGQVLSVPLGGGLVRDDKVLIYPIIDDIPMMLVDEGIPLAQLDG